MSTYHCIHCGRAIFRAEHILGRTNLWDLTEYQAECYSLSALIDQDSLTRYDASLHEGWYCCRFIAMRMVVDKFGTGDDLLVYTDSVVEIPDGQSPPKTHQDKGQIKLREEDFDAVLQGHALKGTLAVVKLGAIWCPPCRLMDSVISKISEKKLLPNVKFFEVDIDEEQNLAARFRSGSIPYFVFYLNGERIRLQGPRPSFVDGGFIGGIGEKQLIALCHQVLASA